MILTRYSNKLLIRAAAIMSVLLGLLYLPSLSNISLPLVDLGHERIGGQTAAELWAMYAVLGGCGIFCGSFLINRARSIVFNRFILGIALLSVLLLAAAQLPPLFWWMFVIGAVFSWSGVLGLTLHLLLLVLTFWGAIVTLHTFERRS